MRNNIDREIERIVIKYKRAFGEDSLQDEEDINLLVNLIKVRIKKEVKIK